MLPLACRNKINALKKNIEIPESEIIAPIPIKPDPDLIAKIEELKQQNLKLKIENIQRLSKTANMADHMDQFLKERLELERIHKEQIQKIESDRIKQFTEKIEFLEQQLKNTIEVKPVEKIEFLEQQLKNTIEDKPVESKKIEKKVKKKVIQNLPKWR